MNDKGQSPSGIRGEMLSLKETARRMFVSPSWIYGHLRNGRLPFRFLQPCPGRYFFDSADIDDYLASCWRSAGKKETQ